MFVEWVRAVTLEEMSPLHYRVGVLVRSLVAQGEEIYHRVPPMLVTVEVLVAEDGARVVLPPTLAPLPTPEPEPLALVEVPPEIQEAAMASSGATEVIGGIQTAAGDWQVVVVAAGPDGVARPTTVNVP